MATIARVLDNLYPEARSSVTSWPPNRWHKHADKINSSQALCVSVFATLHKHKHRGEILSALLQKAGMSLDLGKTPELEPEHVSSGEILNEVGIGTPTSVDVLVTSSTGILTIEAKFTETDFGSCSQWPKQCTGNYEPGSDLKTKTDSPCRLSVWDGRRAPRLYWAIAPTLFRSNVISVPQQKCPFSGPHYQLMRNLSFAAALASRRGVQNYGFLVLSVGAAPHHTQLGQSLSSFQETLRPEIRPKTGHATYEDLATILRKADQVPLATFIEERIKAGLELSRDAP